MSSGIYGIHNLVNDKWYVGQAVDIEKRWATHRWALSAGKNESEHFLRAWRKYGADAFEWLVLEECSPDVLDEREMLWIAKKDSFRNGYNRTVGGGGCPGRIQSDEEKHKRSEVLSAIYATPEYRDRRSALSKAMWKNSEYRDKLLPVRAAAMSTPEYKEKISKTSKSRYQDPAYRENYRRKIRAYFDDPANREKILRVNRQTCANPERNRKIGEFHRKRYAEDSALRGKVSSESAARWADPEMRSKMQAAQSAAAQKRATKILQVETGIVYPSMRAAADAVGGTRGTICGVCKGKRLTAYGFHWRYADSKD